MRCKKCGEPMRLKDVYMGDDEYGDPIYNEYAFCDYCRIKKNVEHLRADYQPPKIKKGSDPSASSIKNKKSPKKKEGNFLNGLIIFFGILILLMIAFIAILWNKDKIPFVKDLFPSNPAAEEDTDTTARNYQNGGLTLIEIESMLT